MTSPTKGRLLMANHVLLLLCASMYLGTGGSIKWLMPLNAEMATHIQDATRLHQVLDEWMRFNRVRVALWCVQWAALAWYFARWAHRSRYAAAEAST
jgi:hypothetical protein